MWKRFGILVLSLAWLGCASSSSLNKKEETVTLLLNNGDSIKAQVLDIWQDKVVFKALDWQKAYEYGEVINAARVKGVKLSDGTVLSVLDYQAYRKGEKVEIEKKREEKPAKKKKVVRRKRDELDAVIESLMESGLALSYLNYLSSKRSLSATEEELLTRLQEDETFQETLEDIRFLDRKARKALERAYLFSPDDLERELGLRFDPDEEMDYVGLMQQLHRRFGSRVKMREFRLLVNVLGESGGRAVKELLENYEIWQMVANERR